MVWKSIRWKRCYYDECRCCSPNSGSALISLKGYEVSKTDFDTDLSAGDIVVPTVHYGTGSLQSFIGSLTVKFVTR